jgi:folate-binding protein YgfZ
MLANGVLWRSPAAEGGVVMLVAEDLLESFCRRLAMFVLRAKVTIENATERLVLIGLAGAGGGNSAREALGVVPVPASAIAFGDGATAFELPDRRIAIVVPASGAPIVQAALARHASLVDGLTWRQFGIAAGVPWIRAATSDLFVPQMVNWDVLGGISFQKGCYPGQEIVARMQYLGRLKERLFAFRTDALEVAPAARLYSAAFGADQACGTVVDAAPDPAGGTAVLAVVQIAAVDADDLTLGEPGGRPLRRVPLPYDVPTVAARDGRSPPA